MKNRSARSGIWTLQFWKKISFTYQSILKDFIFARSFHFLPCSNSSSIIWNKIWCDAKPRTQSLGGSFLLFYDYATSYVLGCLELTISCLRDWFLSMFRFRLCSQAKKEEFFALFWQKHVINSLALQYTFSSSFAELQHLLTSLPLALKLSLNTLSSESLILPLLIVTKCSFS